MRNLNLKIKNIWRTEINTHKQFNKIEKSEFGC